MATNAQLRLDTERRYNHYREQTLIIISEQIKSEGFKATKITGQALSAVSLWENASGRKYDWDWSVETLHFRNRYPKRFEIALWHHTELAALSLGRPTFNATGMRLDIVEGAPRSLCDRPPIMSEVLLAYETYATMIKASHVRIMKPVNIDVKNYYETFGYTYVPKDDYLLKRIF